MKISEIKELSSLKFEYKGSIKYNKSPYVLKGMFYKLNSGRSGKPSKFIGYYEGKQQFHTIDVYFTDSDIKETKRNGFEKIVYMNINNLSGTRFKKEISDYLKKSSKQLRKMYDVDEEIEKLNSKKDNIRGNYHDLKAPISEIEYENVDKKNILKYSNEDICRYVKGFLPNIPRDIKDNILWNDDDSLSPVGIYLEYDHSLHYDYDGYDEKQTDAMCNYIEKTLSSSNNIQWQRQNKVQIDYFNNVCRLYKTLKKVNKQFKTMNIYISLNISTKGSRMLYYIHPEIEVDILKKNENLQIEIEKLKKMNLNNK